MTPHQPARLRDLDDAAARDFLAAQHVGRLAFSLHDRVDIEPIHYVYDGDWLFGRTSRGAKLATLLHHPWCALEADRVDGLFDWTSVVAKGVFYLLDVEGSTHDTYGRAEHRLREFVPEIFTDADPAPHRTLLFGVFVHELSGRNSSTR